jgi:SAM-dependent methyltransferase
MSCTNDRERRLLAAIKKRLESPDSYIEYQIELAYGLEHRLWAHGVPAKGRVLEIGCGTGGITLHLARAGFHAVGIDSLQYDPEILVAGNAYARRLGLPSCLEPADAASLPFVDGAFDAIVCFSVVEHLDDPLKALEEAIRVLKPGGVLFVSFPLFWSPHGGHLDDHIRIPWFHILPKRLVVGTLVRQRARKTADVYLSLNRITDRRFRRLIRASRLQVVDFRRSHYLTHPGRLLLVGMRDGVRQRSTRLVARAIGDSFKAFTPTEFVQCLFLFALMLLSRLPILHELTTSGVNYVLRKPGTTGGVRGGVTLRSTAARWGGGAHQ